MGGRLNDFVGFGNFIGCLPGGDRAASTETMMNVMMALTRMMYRVLNKTCALVVPAGCTANNWNVKMNKRMSANVVMARNTVCRASTVV